MKRKAWFLMFIIVMLLAFNGCSDDKKKVTNNDDELQIQGVVIDAINLIPLVNVDVQLWKDNEQQSIVTTNDLGWFLFDNLESGIYKLFAVVEGFHDFSAENIELNSENGGIAIIDMYPIDENIANPFAAISGTIVQAGKGYIPNATISVSSDSLEQTNGYFTSVVSKSDGSYSIPAIPLLDSNQNPIESFRIRVLADGYLIKVLTGVVLQENNTTYLNIEMTAGSSQGNIIFSDDFETEKAWEYTGFWHRQQNSNILNQAYPQFVQLAPNDDSQGYIPYAYQGSYCFWYGDEANGNFLGEYPPQDSLSGGNGYDDNYGILTSPEIDLTDLDNASISFWTYWEIESVNPNYYGYDIMAINVIEVDNGYAETITKLNPYSDPPVEDRESLPYTSGGFNQAPVWIFHNIDISQYVGQKVHIQFDFQTLDSLYNGFRGWFIDDFKVLDTPGEVVPEPDVKNYQRTPRQ
jgi:hypothetical protein